MNVIRSDTHLDIWYDQDKKRCMRMNVKVYYMQYFNTIWKNVAKPFSHWAVTVTHNDLRNEASLGAKWQMQTLLSQWHTAMNSMNNSYHYLFAANNCEMKSVYMQMSYCVTPADVIPLYFIYIYICRRSYLTQIKVTVPITGRCHKLLRKLYKKLLITR